jgi:hypothetical protein
MGCTPSILHHYHHHQSTTTTSNNNNHRNGPAEEGEGVTADSTGNSTHLTTGKVTLTWFAFDVRPNDRHVE